MAGHYKVVSLFSGAGGLDLGFAGKFDIVFGNDKSEYMAATYVENFKTKLISHEPSSSDFPAFLVRDVADLKFGGFKDFELDVLAGGPPCQDFSIVRGPEKIAKGPRKGEWERAGIKVSRGRLYSHFARVLARLQPKIFVFENVPGLKSSNNGKAYEVILEDFSKLNLRWSEIRKVANNHSIVGLRGYEILYSNLTNASHLGVPQARKRLIMLGLRRDLSPRGQRYSELKEKVTSILAGKNSLVSRYPLTPLEVFEGKALPNLSDRYAEVMKEYKGVAKEVGTDKALKWERKWGKPSFDAIEDYLALNGIKPANTGEIDKAFEEHTKLLKKLGYHNVRISDLRCPDGSNEIPKESEQVRERMRMIPPGENHEFIRGTEWGVEGRGISLVYRRIHPLKPSYTVVAYGGGGTWGYHYERVRGKLTNRERARLQTFPDWFTFKGSSTQVRAQIGEAVPPLLGKKIAESVSIILRSFYNIN